MALGNSMVWEIRPTTGSNLNGGGFDAGLAGAGTDYSQQAAAQLSLTDLTTVGVSATISSITGGFTSQMVGNVIYIASGTNFTPGPYALKTFISANSFTLDRNCATGAGLAGNGKVGGATASISQQGVPLGGAVVAGNTIWIKKETWNEQAVITAAGSTANGDIQWSGYNSARGDAPTGANRPLNARAGGAGGILANVSRNRFDNLIVSGSSGIGFDSNGQNIFFNCRATSNTGSGFNIGGVAFSCHSDGNTANGFNASGVTFYDACYATGNLGNGFATTTTNISLNNCISYTNFNAGVLSTTAQITLRNNTFNQNGIFGTNDGWQATNPGPGSLVINNIFSNNTRYGVNISSQGGLFADYNDFFGNTTAARNNLSAKANDQTLDPQYKNVAGGDFRIGTNLRRLGFPGTFQGPASTVGYKDMGAVERKEENQSVYLS